MDEHKEEMYNEDMQSSETAIAEQKEKINNEDMQSSEIARHGNFICYYNFHPAENRMRLMPEFTKYFNVYSSDDIVCLDVGCNTGELTRALHKHVESSFDEVQDTKRPKCHIMAVDLDDILILRAKEMSENECISFFCVDVLTDDFTTMSNQYLNQHNKDVFDIVFCFSVTMWIHINNGDDALKQFIATLCKITNYLIIEPQPWKCYGRAVRRMRRGNGEPFEQFDGLTIRGDVESYIGNLITGSGFVMVCQTGISTWGRRTNIYRRAEFR